MRITLAVAVSALAAVLVIVLLALAVGRLVTTVRQRREGDPGPPPKVPGALVGWIGLVAFGAGMLLGRFFWA